MTTIGWLWPVLAAPFIGSFLGVLVSRLPAERPVAWSRSACEGCGHTLRPLDLVPVASWFALRGRCRYCNAPIGWLAPATELGAVVIALWVAAGIAEGWMLWASCALGWALLALALIDWRAGILPDVLTLPLLVLGLAVTYFSGADLLDSALGAAVGFLLFAAIRWLYQRLRGREGMGLGDAKLLAAAGAWVGWGGLPSIVLIAAGLGLAAALVMAWRGRRITGDLGIAFGPALCAGLWLVWLYGPLA